MTRVDPVRGARVAALAAWTAAFWWLWTTGAWARFIGPRTHWIVAFGSIALALATVVAAAGLLRSDASAPRRLRVTDVLGTWVLLAPLIVLIAVPRPSLGALAAGNKASGNPPPPVSPASADTPLDNYDLAAASGSATYARERGVVDGRPITVQGTAGDIGNKGLNLTRFRVWCCLADAIAVQVRVVPANGVSLAAPPDGGWTEASGTVRRIGRLYVVWATSLVPADKPDQPFLTS